MILIFITFICQVRDSPQSEGEGRSWRFRHMYVTGNFGMADDGVALLSVQRSGSSWGGVLQ